MKLTESMLRKIIREELEGMTGEAGPSMASPLTDEEIGILTTVRIFEYESQDPAMTSDIKRIYNFVAGRSGGKVNPLDNKAIMRIVSNLSSKGFVTLEKYGTKFEVSVDSKGFDFLHSEEGKANPIVNLFWENR